MVWREARKPRAGRGEDREVVACTIYPQIMAQDTIHDYCSL